MAAATSRKLNAFDLCMCAINDTFRKSGDVGFEAMSVIELDGCVDFKRIEAALVELSNRHPVLTAKLRRNWTGYRWDWHDAKPLSCQRQTCDDASQLQEVLLEILNTPRDLTQQPGIAFYLINLSGERDVFVTHVNHVLVDHLSSQLVLKELTQILNGDPTTGAKPVTDLPRQYRQRFSLTRRLQALLPRLPSILSLGGTKHGVAPRTLDGQLSNRTAPYQAFFVRHLSADETASAMDNVRSLSRFPSTSMAILASAIRVFSRFTKRTNANDVFRIGLGSEVVQQSIDNFHPQNVSSVIRLELEENELDDRAHCVARFNDQIRMSLKTHSELAALQLISEYRWCYPLVKLVSGRAMCRAFSFWYAYFRVKEEDYHQFAGLPVRKITYFGPAWHPLGMTLLVSHFRDQIELTLTYLPDYLSEAEAEQYCEAVARELAGQVESLASGA